MLRFALREPSIGSMTHTGLPLAFAASNSLLIASAALVASSRSFQRAFQSGMCGSIFFASPLAVAATRLAAADYREVINFTFVEPGWEADFAGQTNPIRLLNPIISQQSVMRTTLIGSLISKIQYNHARKVTRIRIFEVGRVFLRDPGAKDGPLSVAGVRQPVRIGAAAFGLQAYPERPKTEVVALSAKIEMELGEPDASGRRRPVATGSTETMKADLVIMALGNASNPIIKDSEPGLHTTRWGTIDLDHAGSQETSIHGVYTGGDAARGGSTAINAAGDGQAAAEVVYAAGGVDEGEAGGDEDAADDDEVVVLVHGS